MVKSLTKLATPLIFDATQEEKPYTTVWRIVDSSNRTPYDKEYSLSFPDDPTIWLGDTWSDAYQYLTSTNDDNFDFNKYDKVLDKTRKHAPHPNKDNFTKDDLKFLNKEKYFAFRTPDEYSEWFSSTERKRLEQLGFKLVPVKASKVWGSGKQVFYEPYIENIEKKVASIKSFVKESQQNRIPKAFIFKKATQKSELVVFDDGTKKWYVDGKLHREDGPAIEWPNGNKEWYINDNLHRIDGPAIEYTDGSKHWYLNGKRHREDGPAVEYIDGTKSWWVDGILHREDGPAVEYKDGSKAWYINGKRHREDGPAVEWHDGSTQWYINGKRHRLDGPAVENTEGTRFWYINGELHREDGPAIEYKDGSKHWYLNDELHREDGPAAEHANGFKEWYINGVELEDPQQSNKTLAEQYNEKTKYINIKQFTSKNISGKFPYDTDVKYKNFNSYLQLVILLIPNEQTKNLLGKDLFEEYSKISTHRRQNEICHARIDIDEKTKTWYIIEIQSDKLTRASKEIEKPDSNKINKIFHNWKYELIEAIKQIAKKQDLENKVRLATSGVIKDISEVGEQKAKETYDKPGEKLKLEKVKEQNPYLKHQTEKEIQDEEYWKVASIKSFTKESQQNRVPQQIPSSHDNAPGQNSLYPPGTYKDYNSVDSNYPKDRNYTEQTDVYTNAFSGTLPRGASKHQQIELLMNSYNFSEQQAKQIVEQQEQSQDNTNMIISTGTTKTAETKVRLVFSPSEKAILDKIKAVAEKLGIKVFLAGGILRDKLLGLENEDLDFVCNKDSAKLAMHLAHIYKLEVPVRMDRSEATMIYMDGRYLDLIDASRVFTPLITLEQGKEGEFTIFLDDAFRRDLTINSLLYSLHNNKLYDPTGKGILDIQNRVIRTIINPLVKYKTSAPDILRALRFYATKKGFQFAPGMLQAMKTNAHLLSPRNEGGDISSRRIERELRKAIKTPEQWNKMKGALVEVGLDKYIGKQIEDVEKDLQGDIEYDFNKKAFNSSDKAKKFTRLAGLSKDEFEKKFLEIMIPKGSDEDSWIDFTHRLEQARSKLKRKELRGHLINALSLCNLKYADSEELNDLVNLSDQFADLGRLCNDPIQNYKHIKSLIDSLYESKSDYHKKLNTLYRAYVLRAKEYIELIDWCQNPELSLENYESKLKQVVERTNYTPSIKELILLHFIRQHLERYPEKMGVALTSDIKEVRNIVKKIEKNINEQHSQEIDDYESLTKELNYKEDDNEW